MTLLHSPQPLRRGSVDVDEWRGLVVICGGMSWDGPWMAQKHIAVRLSQTVPVLYVDPPLSMLRAGRDPELRGMIVASRLTRVGNRLARLSPLVPPGVSRTGLREIAQWVTRRAMARAARTLGGDVHAVSVGSFDNLFGACGERLHVFYGTDDLAAGGALLNLPAEWLQAQEAAQLARANRIVAISEDLAARWNAMGYDVTVIPNGCDATRYASTDSAPLPDDVDLPRPIAGVVGHLSNRIDLDYLEAVADTGQSLLLVGPRDADFQPRRVEAMLRRSNVRWVGPRRFETLPSYLRIMKVGLTPYADTQFNRASFPLKTLEYVAAGRAAISTDLPATRWLDTDLIAIGRTPEEFAKLTVDAVQAPDDEALVQRRHELAARHSWDARVRDFAALLGVPIPA